MSILNPRTTTYEFLGPPGAFLVSVGVPIATYALYFACSESSGGCPPSLATIPLHVSDPNWWKSLWDTDATLIYFAWYFFCVLAWAVLPGDRVSGTTLRTGEKKQYKINGTFLVLFLHLPIPHLCSAFSTYLLTLGITSGVIYRYGLESVTFIYNKWVGFVTASLLMSILQAFACYFASFKSGKLLALGGNTGNHLYDVCPSYPSFVDLLNSSS
jgi:delta14-sterol reductase